MFKNRMVRRKRAEKAAIDNLVDNLDNLVNTLKEEKEKQGALSYHNSMRTLLFGRPEPFEGLKHDWKPSDRQGYSMECTVCGKGMYVEFQPYWDESVDDRCPGTETGETTHVRI